MAALSCDLQRIENDLRTNSVAYRFTVRNEGEQTVHIVEMREEVPPGAAQQRSRTEKENDLSFRHKFLCYDLEKIALRTVLAASDADRARGTTTDDGHLLPPPPSRAAQVLHLASVVSRMLPGAFTLTFPEPDETRGVEIDIYDTASAEAARARYMSTEGGGDSYWTKLYDSKLEYLRITEKELLDNGGVVTVDPGAEVSRTYVFDFDQSRSNPKKYSIAMQAVYQDRGASAKHIAEASITEIIPPREWSLNLVACMGGLLGWTLNILKAASPSAEAADARNILDVVWRGAAAGGWVAALILAFITFNIYEHTALKKRFTAFGVSWRSALVIGGLCGLGSERIVDALLRLVT